MKTNHTTKKLIIVASLAAISIVFSMYEIPLGLPWLKLDVSELLILVAAIVAGYKSALSVVLVRGFFRQLFQGHLFMPTEWVGELIAILASIILLATYFLVSKLFKRSTKPLMDVAIVDPKPLKWQEYAITTALMTLSLTVIMVLLNIFFLTPIYLSAFSFTIGSPVILEQFHFTAFTLLNDPGMSNVFYTDLSSWKLYVTFIIANYTLLNVSKGLVTSMLFLPIRTTLEKIEI